MKTRTLGRTGFELTEIGFGAWAIGGSSYGAVSETDAENTIHTYIEGGGNFIDTARGYRDSELRLGNYFAKYGDRDQIFIASKTGKLAPEEIRADLETALNNLQTDYIDLYYLHRPPEDPKEMNRTLDVYEQFKAEGKIRAIGASIKGPDVTQSTVDLCRQYIHTKRIDALQVIYSIFRQKNANMFIEAQANGVGIVARTVLESGFLTGKYKPGQIFDDHRRRWGGEHLENILQQTQDIEKYIQPPFETLAQIAIQFALERTEVTTLILGAKNANQVAQNLAADHLPLLDSDLYDRLVTQFAGETESFNTGA